MENENWIKDSSGVNENNSFKRLVKNLSRKSMIYRLKFNPIKPLENRNINNNNNKI